MNMLLNRKFLFVLVALSAFNTSVAQDSADGVLAGVESAREVWLQNLSMYGSYTYKQTAFYSEQDAHVKNIEIDKNATAKGVMCKLGDKWRLQVIYLHAPHVVAPNILSYRSCDDVVNKNYWIWFNPEQGNDYPASGSLNKKVAASKINQTLHHLESIHTPVCLSLDPIQTMPSNTTIVASPEISQLDDERTKLVLTGESDNGYRYVKEVIVRTKEKIPVIEQIVLNCFNVDGNAFLYSVVTKVLEWKACGNQIVPSHIRFISGPSKAVGSDRNSWIVSVWQSRDLGERNPVDSDFVLKLPDDEYLVGMNSYPQNGLVDIDTITEDDFTQGIDYPSHKLEWSPNNSLLARCVLLVTSAVIIVLIFIVVRRKKQ